MKAQWDPFFRMLPRCCYYCKYRHFLTRCEGAGTNNSLRERRHEHVVRLDEEELPTAAFIFMKVTVLEELRVFGVVAVAPLVEHVDAWTLGPLPSKQTIVHSTLQQRRLLQPIRGTTCAARICAVARLRIHRQNQTVRPRGACLCKEAVMIIIRLQCLVLRRYGVEDANWSHPIFPPVTTATILAARNFFPPP